jgi:Holliday junction resolvasome RuvABC ATP-dependent DNA helicase subunit
VGDASVRYADVIGQDEVISRLKRFGEFFTSKGSPLGHILFIGERGIGKSTVTTAVANELDVPLQVLDGAKMEILGDLTAVMTNLRPRQILFVESVHLLRRPLLHALAVALKEGQYEIVIGQRSAARTHVFEISPFTLVATCPQKADCPAELLDKFSLILSFETYSIAALEAIADRIARRAKIILGRGAESLIARACDGRPAHLESLIERIKRAIDKDMISEDEVSQAFVAFGIGVRSTVAPEDIGALQTLSGVDFERLVTTLLARMGFQTEMTRATGDGGIDIVALLDRPIFGGRYLFQCKRFAQDNLVGASTVRDFYGAVSADRAVKGVLVTTSGFTVQAREFGERAGLELIDLTRLRRLLLEYGLAAS